MFNHWNVLVLIKEVAWYFNQSSEVTWSDVMACLNSICASSWRVFSEIGVCFLILISSGVRITVGGKERLLVWVCPKTSVSIIDVLVTGWGVVVVVVLADVVVVVVGDVVVELIVGCVLIVVGDVLFSDFILELIGLLATI